MKKSVLLAFTGVLLLSGNAIAGWYHVENFEGSIGSRPVHLSLQTYDSFGSGLNVEGSYYYDDELSPIALYGKLSDARLELCEISDDEDFDRIIIQGSETPFVTSECRFVLDLADVAASGTRSDGTKSEPVALTRVATLDDVTTGETTGTVEIPFWKQTATHMFVGSYAKSSAGICMSKMEIVNKANQTVDQTIEFDMDQCNAGMVMTPIYLNVEKYDADGAEIISVNFLDNQGGYAVDYTADPKTGFLSEKK